MFVRDNIRRSYTIGGSIRELIRCGNPRDCTRNLTSDHDVNCYEEDIVVVDDIPYHTFHAREFKTLYDDSISIVHGIDNKDIQIRSDQ